MNESLEVSRVLYTYILMSKNRKQFDDNLHSRQKVLIIHVE